MGAVLEMSNAEAAASEASSASDGGGGMSSSSSSEGELLRENFGSLLLDFGDAEAALFPSLCLPVGGEPVTVETVALERVIGGSPGTSTVFQKVPFAGLTDRKSSLSPNLILVLSFEGPLR